MVSPEVIRFIHMRAPIFFLLLLMLSACSSQLYHVVERDETLYSIGWIYGYEYQDIARWNNVAPPYQLIPGQRLRVSPPPGSKADSLSASRALIVEQGQDRKRSGSGAQSGSAARSLPASKMQTTSAAKKDSLGQVKQWRWPTAEKRILSTFAKGDPTRQGLGIAGEKGNPVYAAANGRVVYAGSGLPRYGRLIIVKHNEIFLSAYAHNHKLRVKEGQMVNAGQQIADLGSSGTSRSKLYFEIRRHGKPVDPLRYLPK